MNTSKTIVAAMIGATLAGSIFAADADKAITGFFGADVKTGYLSNGKLLVDDAVIQPYAGICFGNFTFDIWASQDLQNDEQNEMEEIDYTLSYSDSCGDINYTIAAVIWAYDNSENDYRAYASVSYENDYLVPTIYARYNIKNCADDDHGIYSQFKLSKGFDLGEGFGLSAYAAVGYADTDYRKSWGVESSGFIDFECSASISYAVTSQLSVSAGCLYNSIMSSELRKNGVGQADEKCDHVIGFAGVSIDL